ncbi:MAG: hypothetical protein IID35_01725 [Planctomycetes bacterium]|nr:hypothetical protein [Planctomycetota bacterium]
MAIAIRTSTITDSSGAASLVRYSVRVDHAEGKTRLRRSYAAPVLNGSKKRIQLVVLTPVLALTRAFAR